MFKKIIKFTFIFFLLPSISSAFTVTQMSDVPVKGDFVLFPAKINLTMSAEQTAVGKINILNRSGESSNFYIDLENREDEAGLNFSDYSSVDNNNFTLQHGEKIEVDLNIKFPYNFGQKDAGGIVFVSSQKTDEAQKTSGAKVIARLGSRVEIDIVEKEKPSSVRIFIVFVLLVLFYLARKWKRK